MVTASPWLSILVPVYNVKGYLDDCFQSILSQCDTGVEVIALDDQSSDGSYDYLSKIASDSSHPIKIMRHPINRGLSAARNSLVAEATGNYVWFLDSDDALVEGAIAQLRNIVNQHNPDLVMCDYQMWRPELLDNFGQFKKELHLVTFAGAENCLISDPEQLFQGLYKKGKLHAWSKISKRSLWQDGLQFPEGKYFEDMVNTPRLALKVNTYYYCPQVWIKYRQREGSILATFNTKKIDDMISGLDGVLAVWADRLPKMRMATRYIYIRYCVKIYLYAVKEAQRIGVFSAEEKSKYRSRLFSSIAMGRRGLVKHYMRFGDFFRLAKALKALH
ncbi:glycosyltransferase family 2 protein [Cellvibrio sp. OA-2007]|uniref:glycosyltransferase family 2 protein n=1 Tax=Cellvibrio sp. OA-2007 TaxID=529823 RepID=UPI000781B6F4|nr:glycosyltransferase family 2 protein [Cellvibrio sp. OA-2007]